MSVLTVVTDLLLAGVAVWLIRAGALAHARDLWGRARVMGRTERPTVLSLRLVESESLTAIHRPTARRWDGLRPSATPIVLGEAGDELRIERAGDGSVVVAPERGVAVVTSAPGGTLGEWRDRAPQWIVAIGRTPSARGAG